MGKQYELTAGSFVHCYLKKFKVDGYPQYFAWQRLLRMKLFLLNLYLDPFAIHLIDTIPNLAIL